MKKSLLTLVMLIVSIVFSYSQITTSGISGKVTDNSGEVIGATIQAIHIPSGTVYGTITNSEGRYTISGMRAGGPYTIKVTYVGMDTKQVDNVTLQLGETFRFNCQLQETAELLAEAVVVGNAIDASKTGAATFINAAKIQELPSLSHSVSDIVRMTPQVRTNGGAMYFAGTNNRYNSFQVDGAMQNDVFGLTSNGSNGGLAGVNPLSIETVEQMQINIAPFDVRQSGFTGGSINAVTKSGTNEFKGSVYTYIQNQSLIGDKYKRMNGTTSDKLGDQHDNTYGITLGGPIIKDKLFFFANYERTDKEYDNVYGPGAEGSKVDGKVAQEILDYVKTQAKAQGVDYNASLGTPKEYTRSHKLGVKLDWNINERNHASLRYSLVTGEQLNQTSTASSLVANSYAYEFQTKTNTVIFELQSRLNDNMSNELRLSYVGVRDKRNPSSPFPMIQISNVGNGTLYLGNERSSMANALDQDIWSITDNFNWYLGNHTLTFGTHDEFYKFSNLFIQDAYGTYIFSNVDDFYAGKINRYRFGMANTSVTGDPRWAAQFSAGQLGFYVQDKWSVNDKLDLTLGIRADLPLFMDTPAENVGFNTDAKANGWNYKTNQKLSSAPMWSPRLGFNYNIDDENKFILRGGVGIFTGRVPFVWLSNNFSNTGIQTMSYSVYPKEGAINISYDPNNQPGTALVSGGEIKKSAQTINVFDKDFKFAQTLRVNLGLDAKFAGIKWTFDALYAKTINDILVQNLNVTPTGKTFAQEYGVSFDNRPMFTKGDYSGIYALTNTDGGYSYNLSLKAEKSFDFGLDLMASYTYSDARLANLGGSSVAASNWQYNYTYGDPNNPKLIKSPYNRPNRILASAYYHHNWNKTSKTLSNVTTIGLVYEGISGGAYTMYVNGDLNGDNGYNDQMYIFTDAQIDEMLNKGMFKATSEYTAEAQAANLKKWLAAEPFCKEHRGEHMDMYDGRFDFEHTFDLHIDHKVGFMIGKDMRYLTIGFDVLNVGNMLNKEWGRTLGSGYSYYSPLTYSKGQYQFLHPGDYEQRSYSDFYSRWRGQVSIKLQF